MVRGELVRMMILARNCEGRWYEQSRHRILIRLDELSSRFLRLRVLEINEQQDDRRYHGRHVTLVRKNKDARVVHLATSNRHSAHTFTL